MKKIILFSKTNYLITFLSTKEVDINLRKQTLISETANTKFQPITIQQLLLSLSIYIVGILIICYRLVESIQRKPMVDPFLVIIACIGITIGYILLFHGVAFIGFVLALFIIQLTQTGLPIFLESFLFGYMLSVIFLFMSRKQDVYITNEKTIFIIL